MKVQALLQNITYIKIEGESDSTLQHVRTDSRLVEEGDIFVCLTGEHTDGHHYIAQAIKNGAVCVVVEKEVETCKEVVTITVSSTVRALAEISSLLYGNPSKELQVIGITGTNGKTSVTHFLNQIYREKGKKTGVIGTMHTDINGTIIPANNTTPFSHDLQRYLHDMKEEGVSHVFMEVSSHGLAMGRTWGCHFTHGAFTNLSQDHLDYHGSMEEYKRAKGLLFTSLGNDFERVAVLNIDDETSSYYQSITGCRILTYGIEKSADLQAYDVMQNAEGLSFMIRYKGEDVHVKTTLKGLFHVYNLMAAIGIALQEKWTLQEIVDIVNHMNPVKGRMENLQCGQPFDVIIDYAHTPDGLENALQSVKQYAKKRILTLVGCGGNRDKGKRPIMAHIAEQYSDYVMLTSDNPRFEDPHEILCDMEKGMQSNTYHKEVDREKAIRMIIREAQPGDVILLAGKGHEEYQVIGDEKRPFSDSEIATREIKMMQLKQ